MIDGTKVILNSSLGRIERVVAEDLGEILLVCCEDEWNRAQRTGEKPLSVGFRKTDLVLNEQEQFKHNGQYEPAEPTEAPE